MRIRNIIIGLMITIRVLAQQQITEIELVHGDSAETATREQLLKLLSKYDLESWLYTKQIAIESGRSSIPHSHPVLTLNTRHRKDDDLLLSTFIHEELHWFITSLGTRDEILSQLRNYFPDAQFEFPQGSGDMEGTYFHIIICHLEYKAIQKLLGELKAFQVFSFWKQDHYKWIYQTVMDNQEFLDGLCRRHNLFVK